MAYYATSAALEALLATYEHRGDADTLGAHFQWYPKNRVFVNHLEGRAWKPREESPPAWIPPELREAWQQADVWGCGPGTARATRYEPEPDPAPDVFDPAPPAPAAFDEPEGECRKSAESAAKARFDLVPWTAIEEIAQVLTFGAAKYDDNNWCRGARWGRYFRALCSHIFKWWRRENGGRDEETGYSHLAHAGCCLIFLMEYERNGWGTDDRFRGPDGSAFVKHDKAPEVER